MTRRTRDSDDGHRRTSDHERRVSPSRRDVLRAAGAATGASVLGGATGAAVLGTPAGAATAIADGPFFRSYSGATVSTADFPDFPDIPPEPETTGSGSGEDEAVPRGTPATDGNTNSSGRDNLQKEVGADLDVLTDYDGFDSDSSLRTVGEETFAVIPSDPQVATGSEKHVTVINSEFGILDKATGTFEKHVRLEDWFANVRSDAPGGFFAADGFIVFDPRGRYDRAADRFVICAVEFNFFTGRGAYLLSVSDDGDPFGTWTNYRIPPLTNLGLVDFPTLGVGDATVTLSQNFFTDVFEGATLVTLDKADLYAGRDVDAVHFTDLRNPDGGLAFTLQPGNGSDGDDAVRLLNSKFFQGQSLTLWEIADPLGSPTISNEAIPVRPYTNPQTAGQPDTEDVVDTIDSRLQKVATDDATGTLWAAHTINDGAIAWYEVDPVGGSLVQSGTFKRAGRPSYIPSIEANGESTVLVYNVSSPKDGTTEMAFPRVEVAGRTSDFPEGHLEAFEVVKEGESAYDLTGSEGTGKDDQGVDVARWGDYNGVTVDPETGTYWTIAQYADEPDEVDEFATRIGEVDFRS